MVFKMAGNKIRQQQQQSLQSQQQALSVSRPKVEPMAIKSSAFSGFYEQQQQQQQPRRTQRQQQQKWKWQWKRQEQQKQRQLQLCRTLLKFQLDGLFKSVIKSLHVCAKKRKCKERMQIDIQPLNFDLQSRNAYERDLQTLQWALWF